MENKLLIQLWREKNTGGQQPEGMEAQLLHLLRRRLSYASFITSLCFSQMREPPSIHPARLSSGGTGRED